MSSLWLHDARCRTLCLQVNIQVNFVFLIVGLMVSSAVPALLFHADLAGRAARRSHHQCPGWPGVRTFRGSNSP